MHACKQWLKILLDIQRLASASVCSVLAGRNLSVVLQAVWQKNAKLAPQQRAAIQDISYGTLRYLGQLQGVLDQLLDKPLRDKALRCLLLVGLYQLQYSKAASHAIVDNAVKTAIAIKQAHAKGLVNAVLRNFMRRKESLLQALEGNEEASYSHPQWWIDKLKMQYPEHWQSILAVNNQHPPMTLRINRNLSSVDAYLNQLKANEISARALGNSAVKLDHPVSVDKLPGFSDGVVSVQDAGAQYAATLLDVKDGMRVLDACSAPGGKTAHILELAKVNLTALDSDSERLQKVSQNLKRLNFTANLITGDAADTSKWWDGRLFDRILADVPCSASGVVRRHPDIKWLRRAQDILQFAEQQQKILDALWRCLAIGGKLLYVTCSVFEKENGSQMAAFLERHQDAQRLPLTGIDTLEGQLIPNEMHDGFYYALLAKG
ncbi:16S rRNA (cytosine967-C5)-methyltransferase [Sulfurirhabdus autotrophica]|uniref:16S rRNA (cytosine(967)-C(5))-methyltransferase n=1 Tax=Sulfurirhabdus autotrophica TaxID=1706046 RepID=A0A4R3XSA7_9PROT|nr:16S rRNA (cytosine967-C5)-methyltransferase [Sulfurirhabdus autotrophica]